MLQDLGFEVLEACHAGEALSHLEATDGVVLLFTDVEMPGCDRDGFGLAREVARRWPTVSIIICSGCKPPAAESIPERAQFISKPCIQHRVHRALDRLRMRH